MRQLHRMISVPIFVLVLTACSSGGSKVNNDGDTTVSLEGTSYFGQYSGTSTSIDSTYPCPNNTAIINFDLQQANDGLTMEFVRVGSIDDLVLNVTRNDSVGNMIKVEASGKQNGYDFFVEGNIFVYELDIHTQTLRFEGSLSANNGMSQCRFDFYSNRD